MDGWKIWIGKKVFLETKSGRRYSGVIDDFSNNILTLIDKNNLVIGISVSSVSIIQEEE